MAEDITLLLLGLGSGAMIALPALGLVLMYRSSGVVNFATGGIGMACSFVLWDLTRNAGWSALPAGVVPRRRPARFSSTRAGSIR